MVNWSIRAEMAVSEQMTQLRYHVKRALPQAITGESVWRVGSQAGWDRRSDVKEGKVDLHRVVQHMFRALDREVRDTSQQRRLPFSSVSTPHCSITSLTPSSSYSPTSPLTPLRPPPTSANAPLRWGRTQTPLIPLPSVEFFVKPTPVQADAIADLYNTLTSPPFSAAPPAPSSSLLRPIS